MTRFLVRKWEPHPAQRAVIDNDARYRIVAAGRRFGKTRMARGEAIEAGYQMPDGLTWIICPSHDDAEDLFFTPMEEAIPDSELAGEPKRSIPREIELRNGHRFNFRSFDSKLRGRGIDRVIIDEAGDMPTERFQGALSPSLIDTEGELLAIGTPRGRNWFYTEFQRGQDPSEPDTVSWRFSSYDNPHVKDAEIERQRERLPTRVFEQEYLAEFADDQGAVFPNVKDRNVRPYTLDTVTGTPPYTIGVDLARVTNYTVSSVIDNDGMLVDWRRWTGGSWANIGRKLQTVCQAHTPGVAYLDATRDNKVIEDLDRAVKNVRIEPVKFTAATKAELVENLAARLETGDIILPETGVDQLLAELQAFTYEATPAGNIRYGAPEGYHDDAVDSLALAAKRRDAGMAKMNWA